MEEQMSLFFCIFDTKVTMPTWLTCNKAYVVDIICKYNVLYLVHHVEYDTVHTDMYVPYYASSTSGTQYQYNPHSTQPNARIVRVGRGVHTLVT